MSSRRRSPWSVVRVGSILWLALQEGDAPRRPSEDIDSRRPRRSTPSSTGPSSTAASTLAPSAYEVMFVPLAHDDTVIDETIAAFDRESYRMSDSDCMTQFGIAGIRRDSESPDAAYALATQM